MPPAAPPATKLIKGVTRGSDEPVGAILVLLCFVDLRLEHGQLNVGLWKSGSVPSNN